MGALVERAGRLEIVEYIEIDPSMQYRYSYTGMMAMKLSFMKQMAGVELPVHWVWKKTGDAFKWKGEKFIFDALPFAERAGALCYPRNQIYAPLKSKENLEEILQVLNPQ
jgi:UDP-N-acetylglucosamine pyrophosphorylase